MIRPFAKFKDMHEDCRNHVATNFYNSCCKCFSRKCACGCPTAKLSPKNNRRKILSSIISCILFCGTYDMTLSENKANEGGFFGLLILRIDSGDKK